MKTRIAAGLVASLVVLTALSAHAGTRKHKAAAATKPAVSITSTSETKPAGDAAKPVKKSKRAKPAAAPKPSYFVASGVPLAEVHDGRIASVVSAKRPCGSKTRWAKKGSAWTALDAWGQVVSTGATLSDRHFFEGSGCHQVQFQTAAGSGETPRLFLTSGSGYTPAPSVRWSPADDVAKRFEHLYAAQETAWVEGKPAKADDPRRTLFFSLPKQEASVEGAPTQRRPIHWAVAGGRVLVVGYVGATGAWKVGHVLPPNGKDNAYEPLAILDMNGDGLPEIVVHEEAGGVYVDRVLSFDAGTLRWEKSVESPGGASK
jgi:hypothetical protein